MGLLDFDSVASIGVGTASGDEGHIATQVNREFASLDVKTRERIFAFVVKRLGQVTNENMALFNENMALRRALDTDDLMESYREIPWYNPPIA